MLNPRSFFVAHVGSNPKIHPTGEPEPKPKHVSRFLHLRTHGLTVHANLFDSYRTAMEVATISCSHLLPPTRPRAVLSAKRSTAAASLSTNFLYPFTGGSVSGDFTGLKIRPPCLNPLAPLSSSPKRGVVTMVLIPHQPYFVLYVLNCYFSVPRVFIHRDLTLLLLTQLSLYELDFVGNLILSVIWSPFLGAILRPYTL